eukprot:568776-Pleurochrysis_carterae.AAC.1
MSARLFAKSPSERELSFPISLKAAFAISIDSFASLSRSIFHRGRRGMPAVLVEEEAAATVAVSPSSVISFSAAAVVSLSVAVSRSGA